MSSSSSYSNSNNNPQAVAGAYDVFLSFRGEDTRRGFTSYLYDALVREGIKPFFDDDNLARGKTISDGLMKAIQGSRSSVVVLSEHYAFSSWCLTELCKIVECMDTSGLIVLPIFYHVNPSHVRRLIGSYKDAFKKHENNPKLDFEEVETCRRDALKRVGNLAGWTLDETVVEPKFIKDFIAHVSRILDIKKKSPHEPAKQSGLQVDHNLTSEIVNPANAPVVVGKSIDDEWPEDFIKDHILPIRHLLPVEQLVKECEKRNRLGLLTQFLEQLVSEGSQDVHVHNALGKIIVNSNNNPEPFLTTNLYYDSRVVGKHCEIRNHPTLAVAAYRRGQCDDELINVTNKNSLFKLQARYVVERMDGGLWEKVLDPKNEYRRQLIDLVVSTALPESKSPDEVSAAIKAFNRFDCFEGPKIAKVALNVQLYEEAFSIYKKLNLNVEAVNVLLDKIRSIDRAVEFAKQVKEDAVWNQVRKAQHAAGDHPVSATIRYPNSNNNPQKVVAEHDVFLSFRGEDSRSGFTSHLYNALEREGIKTIFHDDKGVISKNRSRRIMKAIRGSRSSIVVLSGHYASSSVCLTELCKIVECMDTSELIVVPVFYHVNPSDVRKLMGTYKHDFEEHKKNSKLDFEEVKTWRDALKRVANLPGEWTLAKKDAEARFIKDFIAHVSSLLAIGKETAHEPPRQSTSNDANHRNEEYLVMSTVDQKH